MESKIDYSQPNSNITSSENRTSKIDEILPLIIAMFQYQVSNAEVNKDAIKCYVPEWIDLLINTLQNENKPLSEADRLFYISKAISLTESDFKPASTKIDDSKAKYMTQRQISNLIWAIKIYFKLL